MVCPSLTSMFPIKSEKRTNPAMHKMMQNNVSGRYVVVSKFCPYELPKEINM